MKQNAIANATTQDTVTTVASPLSDRQFQTGGEGVRHHGKRGLYRFILTQKNFCKGGCSGLC